MEQRLICKKCGGEGAESYPLVTVRTMTVRSGGTTQKYHALGEVFSIDLCPACIDAWIQERSQAWPQIRKAAVLPLLLTAVAVAVHFLGLENLIRRALCLLFGGFAVAVAVSEFSRIKKEAADIRAGTGGFTRAHMIEELASTLLPKKHNDAQLTYLLRSRVLDESQLNALNKEYQISRKKLASIRAYLLSTPESEVNRGLEDAENLDQKKRAVRKKRS